MLLWKFITENKLFVAYLIKVCFVAICTYPSACHTSSSSFFFCLVHWELHLRRLTRASQHGNLSRVVVPVLYLLHEHRKDPARANSASPSTPPSRPPSRSTCLPLRSPTVSPSLSLLSSPLCVR
jgi:hypothetical protein